jgi:two-component system response regulator QseB
MRLLLVEDDRMIGRAMRQGLGAAGFTVDWATDSKSAELALGDGVYDLLLLDLGLPGKDGMTLLRDLRRRHDPLPVLIVTARDEVTDRVAGLNEGADDYVLKPFNLDELVARVRALLRRRATAWSDRVAGRDARRRAHREGLLPGVRRGANGSGRVSQTMAVAYGVTESSPRSA